MKRAMLRPTIVFLPKQLESACRCGAPDLAENCPFCERAICQDCAIFIDPDSQLPTRPSQLIAKGCREGMLAHRTCLDPEEASLIPCVYSKDISVLLRILKGPRPLGRPAT
jgi:hypothetical protein